MTPLQQGWIFCVDGFAWLQRLTADGVLDPRGLCVDLSELTGPPEPVEAWQELRSEDGWYLGVPVSMVNDLVASHGGIVDVLSSRLDIQSGS